MLHHSLLVPRSGVYVEQLTCDIVGPLDRAAFRAAWERVVARYDIFRNLFVGIDGDHPLQITRAQVALPWTDHDWRELTEETRTARFQTLLQDERRRGFDFMRAPLMRMSLIHTAKDRHRFAWSQHHALSDGWSLPIVLQEVLNFYDAIRAATEYEPPPVKPFRDYIRWLNRTDKPDAEPFWRDAMAGFETPTAFPVARPALDATRNADASASLPSKRPRRCPNWRGPI